MAKKIINIQQKKNQIERNTNGSKIEGLPNSRVYQLRRFQDFTFVCVFDEGGDGKSSLQWSLRLLRWYRIRLQLSSMESSMKRENRGEGTESSWRRSSCWWWFRQN
ncbi:hypothetical protein Dimus_035151 [Dionaea muscipula]